MVALRSAKSCESLPKESSLWLQRGTEYPCGKRCTCRCIDECRACTHAMCVDSSVPSLPCYCSWVQHAATCCVWPGIPHVVVGIQQFGCLGQRMLPTTQVSDATRCGCNHAGNGRRLGWCTSGPVVCPCTGRHACAAHWCASW